MSFLARLRCSVTRETRHALRYGGLLLLLIAASMLLGVYLFCTCWWAPVDRPTTVSRTCLVTREDFAGSTRVTVNGSIVVDLYCGDRYVVRDGRCGVEREGAPRVEMPCLRSTDVGSYSPR